MTDGMLEANLKHLEFIQNIITRQAGNSFLLKGWSLTIATATFGYSASKTSWRVASIGALAMLGFWYLDAYYLKQERLFRCLYDDVRKVTPESESLSMNTDAFKKRGDVRMTKVIRSRTLITFYGVIILIGVLLSFTVGVSTR